MNHKAIIGAIIAAVIAGLSAWKVSGDVVTGIIAALVPLAALFPTSAVKPKAGVLALMFLPLAACGPTTWQGAVIRTADTMRQATAKTIPDLMTSSARKELGDCEAKHGKKSATCKAVAAKIVKRLRTWQDKVRPALRATIKALLGIYQEFKAEGKAPRPAPLRPVPVRAGGAK